ncbi:hypothetical protein C8Q75DRAFT_730343 [Abortiporus biennis]|nr:hypothetical protein C8Q75DRAFT_730343 [Abortiporus biennis]
MRTRAKDCKLSNDSEDSNPSSHTDLVIKQTSNVNSEAGSSTTNSGRTRKRKASNANLETHGQAAPTGATADGIEKHEPLRTFDLGRTAQEDKNSTNASRFSEGEKHETASNVPPPVKKRKILIAAHYPPRATTIAFSANAAAAVQKVQKPLQPRRVAYGFILNPKWIIQKAKTLLDENGKRMWNKYTCYDI